jgi:hypothetical protein
MQLRRRLRQQRQAREAMLLDLGALVYELHRQGRRAPELLQQKAAELEVVDGEVRELEDALAGIAPEGEPELADQEPGAGEAPLLEDDRLGEGEWDDEELGEEEDLDDGREAFAEDDDGEGFAEGEDGEGEPLDEYDDDFDAEPAPTVEVDALDDDPRSGGEAHS